MIIDIGSGRVTEPGDMVEVLRRVLGGCRSGQDRLFLSIGLSPDCVIKYIKVAALEADAPEMFHPRETFRAAVMKGAVKVITAHSYPSGPSGRPKPSKSYMGIVKELVRAGEVLGISMIDHLIITDTGYKSICGSKYIN